MEKFFNSVRDTLIAGIIFLLPILVLFVLIAKVVQLLKGMTSKIAGFFGLKTILGLSGHTIITAIIILLLCFLCGYLVRISYFKSVSRWVDNKLLNNIPGYAVYREMAMSKLEKREELLPYESAAWVEIFGMHQPCFLMETMPDGRQVVFFPTAGNTKEGAVFVLPAERVQVCRDVDMRSFRHAISNLGLGFSKQHSPA